MIQFTVLDASYDIPYFRCKIVSSRFQANASLSTALANTFYAKVISAHSSHSGQLV